MIPIELLQTAPNKLLRRLELVAGRKDLASWIFRLMVIHASVNGDRDQVVWHGPQVFMHQLGVAKRGSICRAVAELRTQKLIRRQASRLYDGCVIELPNPMRLTPPGAHAPSVVGVQDPSVQPPAASTTANKPPRLPHGLTPAQREVVCRDLASIKRWIKFGKAALAEPDDAKLIAAGAGGEMDWERAPGWQRSPAGQWVPDPNQWRVPHFAGYYWYLLSWHRDKRGLPIKLPYPNWGKIIGVISGLPDSSTQLYNTIRWTVTYFSVIKFMTRGLTLELNEITLANTLVQEKCMALQAMGPVERKQLIAQAQAAAEAADSPQNQE